MSPSTARARARAGILALGLVLLPSGCGSSSPTFPDFRPDIPTQWAAVVDNTFFPLIPGTRWVYEGESDEGTERVVVEVLEEVRGVNGVDATVVQDQEFLDGELIENTYDWFAQDTDGNVWYLGEESEEIEDGEVVGTPGSWEWGVDGAEAGIYMWADPAAHLDQAYRQEYYRGEAEDWGRVISLDEDLDVVAGSFSGCIRTEDWNALEGRSRSLEHKFYCPAIGLIQEMPAGDPAERIELIEYMEP